MSKHRVGWIDDEICELMCDDRSVGTVSIYDFEPCPACGTPVKLRQVCEVVEGEPSQTP